MGDQHDITKQTEGYQEYREAAGRVPAAKFPWGTLVGNVVGIAGAHAAGYYAGGALANALAKSRVGAKFSRLSPATQKQILAQTVGAAGSVGAMAASLASLAGQVRVAEEISRIEIQQKRERAAGNVKVAALYDAYALALQELYP